MAASATLLAPVARRPTAAAHGRFCRADAAAAAAARRGRTPDRAGIAVVRPVSGDDHPRATSQQQLQQQQQLSTGCGLVRLR